MNAETVKEVSRIAREAMYLYQRLSDLRRDLELLHAQAPNDSIISEELNELAGEASALLNNADGALDLFGFLSGAAALERKARSVDLTPTAAP